MAFTLLNEVAVDTTPADSACYVSDGSAKNLLIDAISFGGGSVTIEVKRVGGQWVVPKLADGSYAIFTAGAVEKVDFVAQGDLVRAKLTGSIGASKVNAKLG